MNEAKEKWRTLIEEMPIGVLLVDCNRKIRDVNKSAVDMIGRAKEEILGRVCHEFVCPTRENDCPVYDHGKTLDRAEVVLLSKDRGDVAIEKTVTTIVVDGEEMLLEMFSDITRRKAAEESLREGEEKYRTFIERTSEGCWGLDSLHKTSEVNPALCNMLGYTMDEMIGRSPHDFVDEDNLKIFRYQMGRIGSTLHRSYEIVLTKKSGEGIPVWFNATTILDDAGEFEGAYSLITDISERKRAEKFNCAQRDLALAINAATGLDDALRLCIDAAIEIAGMDCGGVYLIDDDSGDMDLAFHRGLPAGFVKSAPHYDSDSDSARLVMAGKPIYSQHQELGTRTDDVRRNEYLRATAILPIYHDDRVIACLNMASHTMDEVPAFAKSALETVAAQIGSAIARIKLEDALLQEMEQAKQYLDVAGVVLIIINLDRRVRRINRKGCEILGCGEDDILGKDWFDNFIPEQVRNETIDVFDAFVSGGAGGSNPVEYYENPVLTKKDGGGERIIAWHNAILHDETGKITGVLSSGEDITRRRELEQKLQRAFDRLKASYEELSIPVIQVWDNILAFPIIGVLDNERINRLMETMLAEIVKTQSRVVIIDVTGVRSVDTSVASHLINVTKAAKLLGTNCIVTGIRPEAAHTLIGLGVDMSEITTKRSMQEGLKYALRIAGARVGG
ncbi:MAG: PAS domain S-box protein [Euryarchaeota archaeon]|nr:PAS domain S-box protein [Euryarchaeota archaeon]